MAKRVAVIGGGLGGLSSAVRLAKLGFDVTLFEENSSLGGKMNQFRSNGFRFDTGPSLLTMPFVVDELLEFAGLQPRTVIDYIPLDPICRYFYPDGAVLDARPDAHQMEEEIAKVAPDDVTGFSRFLSYSRKIYETTADLFLWNPVHDFSLKRFPLYLKSLFGLRNIDSLRTVHQAVSSFFDEPKLIQLFDRYATYNGSNPFEAPATLNIIPYVEFGLGGYYISGGMYRLVEVLEDLATSLGVTIRRESRVEKILHSDRRINGVRVDGQLKPAKYVICNADVVTAYNQLLDGMPRKQQKMNDLEPSLSGIVFLWGKRGISPRLKHHNIFFSGDYKREFRQLFQDLDAPDDPTVYVSISSKTDPDHAPQGYENWFVLVNMPYMNGTQNWSDIIDHTRRQVLEKLREHDLDIAPDIEMEQVVTPADFFHRYGSNMGSIYGISSNDKKTAFQRHANRSRDIRGLYFSGGSVHPGGGIPLVLLSGRITANLIAEAEGITQQGDENLGNTKLLTELTEEWNRLHVNNASQKQGKEYA